MLSSPEKEGYSRVELEEKECENDQNNIELAAVGPDQKNWRGIGIALLVILIVCALIVAAIVLLTPDYAGDRDCRLSTSGFMICVDKAAITWGTRKQKAITLSTLEAEYVALTEVVKEYLFLQRVVKSPQLKLTPGEWMIYCDNMAAIQLSKNNIETNRTKHVSIKFHYVREKLKEGHFAIQHISGKVNLADCFTKPSTKMQLKFFTEMLFLK